MTPNDSLTLSCRIQELMRKDMLQFIEPLFPKQAIKEYEQEYAFNKKRDRIYTCENTVMTMLITAIQDDKSLQNSVDIFQEIFTRNRKTIIAEENTRVEALRVQAHEGKPRVGRPSVYKVKLPVSKIKDISLNTAAYSKARGRVDMVLIDKVFKATADSDKLDCVKPWHGRIAYNTDGTYFQMQDTKEIPEKYRAQKSKDGKLQGYPQGLLQVLTQHGSGLVVAYKIAGRTESELKIAPDLVSELPSGSLLLADDLYNCFAFLAHVVEKGVDIIVPEKKDRLYTTLSSLDLGDEIVELARPRDAHRLFEGQRLPEKLVVRRIVYPDTQDPQKTHVLLTTVLDESIDKMEIVMKYASRWDVEITIREIKTMMNMNIARSKTEEMVFKEYGVALSVYNMLRRIVAKSVKETDFSPQTDIFQKLFAPYKSSLVDRRGRVYSRWAPGRPSAYYQKDRQASNSKKAGMALSSKNKGG
jgi:hypothetical protein